MALPKATRTVITGAGSGLGRALALSLARRGARLLLSDIKQDTVEETAALCRSAGASEVIATTCNVASLAEVEAMRDRALDAFGGVDLLINNAGVGVGGEVGETPIEDWKLAIDVNLWGVIHGCHAFVPVLRRQRAGNVLNVASAAGLVSTPHMAPYNATKAAVVALSETLHVELAAQGIGVTVLCPTFFETNILRDARSVEPRYQRFASNLTRRSRIDAQGVAEHAIAEVEKGALYAVPMLDGRVSWGLKRLSPTLYSKLSLALRARIEKQKLAIAMYAQRLLPLFRPHDAHRPRSITRPEGVSIRWLGTAGHVISHGETTLLLDPFLSRSSFLEMARPLRPDPASYWQHLPPSVNAVLLGHSHYDHLLDAPAIAKGTGALIVGSASTAAFARAEGVDPRQIVEVPPAGLTLSLGEATVRFVPSLHGKLFAGRVPFPGEVRGVPRLPARVWDYRMGGAFGLLITLGGVTIYHNGSANLVDAELDGLSADVVLLGLAGRRGTPGYVERITSALRPSLLVPTHHDAFFAPLETGLRLLPGVDLDGFVETAKELRPSARVITPLYDDAIVVPSGIAASEAVVVSR